MRNGVDNRKLDELLSIVSQVQLNLNQMINFQDNHHSATSSYGSNALYPPQKPKDSNHLTSINIQQSPPKVITDIINTEEDEIIQDHN